MGKTITPIVGIPIDVYFYVSPNTINDLTLWVNDVQEDMSTTVSGDYIVCSLSRQGSATGILKATGYYDAEVLLSEGVHPTITMTKLPSVVSKLSFNSTDYIIKDANALHSTEEALPSQSGQSGKFLTTNGTTASWATVDALPSQTGQSGKYLTTNGTSASWATAAIDESNIVHLSGAETITGVKSFDETLQLKNNLSFRSYGTNDSGRLQFRAQPADNVIRGTVAITDGYTTAGSGYSGFVAQMVARAGSTSSDPFNTMRVSNKGIEYIKEENDGTITGQYVVVDSDGLIPSDRLATSGSTGQVLTKTASGQSWQTINALPSQSGQSGKYLTTNGTTASWTTITIPVVDQSYDGTSANAQSGIAVKSAIDTAISSVYKPAGSVAFANLPTLSSSIEGYVYNVSDSFTTTTDFVEGAGHSYPAGTNVVCINTIAPVTFYAWKSGKVTVYTDSETPSIGAIIYDDQGVATSDTVNSVSSDSITTTLTGINLPRYSSGDISVQAATYKWDVLAGFIDLSGYVKKDGGSAQQTIQLTSGTGTTAFGVKSMSTGSYISFSGTNGWLASYGVTSDRTPTFYNGTSYTLAYKDNILDYYGTCATAASTQAKVVVCEGFVLKEGVSIRVKFTNNQSYNGNPTLNVNGTGAISVKAYGTTNAARYYWRAGEVVAFTYDGTNWIMEDGAIATTSYYGVTALTTSATSTSDARAATPASINSLVLNMIEPYPVYSSSATYAVGDRVRYSYNAWECNTAITTAEAWTEAHWTKIDDIQTQIEGKQATLVSGTNIKTINNQSILGSGNIDIQGGTTVEAYTAAEVQTIWDSVVPNS